jgi:hypothetical protein
MPGGLINIATYGSQDLFLTGTPEITYFKLVYRRHTNFAMESIRLKFDDTINFDKFSTLTIPKAGDLIHKTYLEVILPEIYFKRNINAAKVNELLNLYDKYLYEYEIIRCFMKINVEAYRKAIEIYELDNINNSSIQMINAIIATFNDNSGSDAFPCSYDIDSLIEVFKSILENTTLSPLSPIVCKYVLCKFYYNFASLLEIAENPTPDMLKDKDVLKLGLDHAIKHSTLITEYFQWLLIDTERQIVDEKSHNLKSAWVKRIGHSLIEYVNVYIGGDIIDKQYGEWIDIWYELTANKELEDSYMKMIGNIPELTTFDRSDKPKTVLFVPLIFWFNRHNGQALPLVSMQYHDVQIGLKVRKFSELFYVENTGTNVNLDVLYEDAGFQLNINLLTDFVYLDTIERRKFAQSGHEYLVDIIQAQYDDNDILEYKTRLEFTNPSKEIVWVIQRKSLLSNPTGSNECQWTNYGVYLDGTGDPCDQSQIFINGTKLLDKQKYGFFNDLMPFYCHTNTPADGVNCYSFALMPEEHQPSGSCNMSRLSLAQLIIDMNPNMLFELDKNSPKKITTIPEVVTVKIFSISQNILRVLGGMGSLAFT